MDDIDMKLLDLLQDNSRISITELSKLVNLSRPSISARIKKMEDEGIIENFTVITNPEKIGREHIFFIEASEIKTEAEEFEKILKEIEAITEIYMVAGKNNYILKGSTKDMDSMDDLLQKLMQYSRIETSMVIKTKMRRQNVKPML